MQSFNFISRSTDPVPLLTVVHVFGILLLVTTTPLSAIKVGYGTRLIDLYGLTLAAPFFAPYLMAFVCINSAQSRRNNFFCAAAHKAIWLNQANQLGRLTLSILQRRRRTGKMIYSIPGFLLLFLFHFWHRNNHLFNYPPGLIVTLAINHAEPFDIQPNLNI